MSRLHPQSRIPPPTILKPSVLPPIRKRLRQVQLIVRSDFTNLFRFGFGAPRAGQRIYIDPKSVDSWVSAFDRRDTGRVLDGNWDKTSTPFSNIFKVGIVHRKISQNITWEEAGAYDNMLRLIRERGDHDECRNIDDIRERYRRLDTLIEHLASGGRYLTATELGGMREFGGIYIHVGRYGEALFGGSGCHRLAIAQALGLKSVPAQVGVVHLQAVQNGKFHKLARPPK